MLAGDGEGGAVTASYLHRSAIATQTCTHSAQIVQLVVKTLRDEQEKARDKRRREGKRREGMGREGRGKEGKAGEDNGGEEKGGERREGRRIEGRGKEGKAGGKIATKSA